MSEKCAGCGVSLDVRVGADLVTHQLDDGTKWHFCCLVEHERDSLQARVKELEAAQDGVLKAAQNHMRACPQHDIDDLRDKVKELEERDAQWKEKWAEAVDTSGRHLEECEEARASLAAAEKLVDGKDSLIERYRLDANDLRTKLAAAEKERDSARHQNIKDRVMGQVKADCETVREMCSAKDEALARLRTLLSTVRGALELARDSSAYETIRQAARDALSKLNATDGKGQQKYPSDARILDAQARNHKARMQPGSNATDGDGDGED
jgi:hypothetical protein